VQLVTLQNKGRTPLTLILPHETACAEGSCLCGMQTVGTSELNPESGELTSQVRAKRMPMSLQLFGGEASGPLPETVKRCPDVAKAMRAGALLVEACKPPAPPVEGAGPGAAAPPAADTATTTTTVAASSPTDATLAPPGGDAGADETRTPGRRGRNQER